MRYWEDFAAGQVYELGSMPVTSDDIVGYAKEWDPQPFHVDPERAARTWFGGLVASGWHTAAIFMRLYVDNLLLDSACEGGLGMDEMRWLRPVRPGDTLSARAVIDETWASGSNPNRGYAKVRWELRNSGGDVVMRAHCTNLFGRRSPA